ncbi:homoserine O-acetyltransferase [Colletotrichum spaethianum]|uniref:Homoserine O-acetyltransferase n=1 Tax=Colletotrichum spaethianum TaxID=700344 RepID=A0AA37UK62_9PEZI|nr:homoserine O-acetyltransferase [Colletotrichum spaethianum]GKT49501.1 homoserine O-acetyltransferase [Colletotrichum spaethianum]
MALLLDSNPNPTNFYARLIRNQRFAAIQRFQLESGELLADCPVAYRTWGKLNDSGDNVLVVCHALTGSSDVSDWWSPLIGPGKAFDPRHFFIFCGNVLGSPYGSASPLTINPDTGRSYASQFPQTTIRDDVKAHKLVLDALGVKSIAAVVGGSMGGMTTLEWPLCAPPGFVRNIIPIATAADHSAWGISWAETQRQCIYSDPKFDDGYYEPTPEGQPSAGLAAARMIAMLTYRSCTSFDNRFGRKPPRPPSKPQEPLLDLPRTEVLPRGMQSHGGNEIAQRKQDPSFSAQGYLHYQGEKFIKRFDANCYLHITNKMDSHDVAYGRAQGSGDDGLAQVLSSVPSGALVISVETDALFLPEQQERLAAHLPGASLSVLKSSDGHDGFLLEFEQLDVLIQFHLRSKLPDLYTVTYDSNESPNSDTNIAAGGSLTGELESY